MDYDTTSRPEEYGHCDMCDKPLSEYDFMHSQGSHCADCFKIIQRQVAGGDVHISMEIVEAPPPLKAYHKGFASN